MGTQPSRRTGWLPRASLNFFVQLSQLTLQPVHVTKLGTGYMNKKKAWLGPQEQVICVCACVSFSLF